MNLRSHEELAQISKECHREIQQSFARMIAILEEMIAESESAHDSESVETALTNSESESAQDALPESELASNVSISEQIFSEDASDAGDIVSSMELDDCASSIDSTVDEILPQLVEVVMPTNDVDEEALTPMMMNPPDRDISIEHPSHSNPFTCTNPLGKAQSSLPLQFPLQITVSVVNRRVFDEMLPRRRNATPPLHVIFGFDPGGHHDWKEKQSLDFDNVFMNCSFPFVLEFHQRNDTLLMSLYQFVIEELQGISIKQFSLFENTMTVLGGLLPSRFIAIDNALVFDTTTIIAIASVDLFQAVDPHGIKLMIIMGDRLLTVEFRILRYCCPSNPIAEDVTIGVFLWALCAMCSQIGVGIVYQKTHQIYASWSVSWFKLNAQDFLLFVERPLNITYLWNIVLFQYMNTISTRPQISPSQKIKLSLANVLFACNTFESLLLGRQGLASLVQNYSAISVECKELSFGYFIGSALKPYAVAFGSTELAKVGDYSCSSTLTASSFGYLVWISEMQLNSFPLTNGVNLMSHDMSKVRDASEPPLVCQRHQMRWRCLGVVTCRFQSLEHDQQLKVLKNVNYKTLVNSNLRTIIWKAPNPDDNLDAHAFVIMLINCKVAVFILWLKKVVARSCGLKDLEITDVAELFRLFGKEFIEVKSLVSADWEQMVVEMLDKFETSVIFLNDTSVENRLQNRVSSCFGRLPHMGIQPWVLTGDTIEIVLTIGFAYNLIFQGRQLIINCFNTPETKSFDAIDVTSTIGLVHHMHTRLLILGICRSFAIIGTTDCAKYMVMSFGTTDCANCLPRAFFFLSFGGAQQWDPGGQLDMLTVATTYQLRHWDPGQFVPATINYNLEDKVVFDGEGNVMSQHVEVEGELENEAIEERASGS